jgi:Flp pilus assembly protein protease CpaA
MKNLAEILSVALTVIFIVFKATQLIDWSWWWVISPLIGIPVSFFAGYFVLKYIGGIDYDSHN